MATNNNSLKVAELYSSIQGETSRAGLKCSFVRLAGCNLDCNYCDTDYAREGGEEIAIDRIVTKINDMTNRLVCVTGGEPLLQKGTTTLVETLLESGYNILVETNGSLPIEILPPPVWKIVDVKTPGSGEDASFHIPNLEHLTVHDELKFVIADRNDFDWAKSFIGRHGLGERCELLASPVYGKLDPAELAGWIIESNIEMRLNLQLHKILWGEDARGV